LDFSDNALPLRDVLKHLDGDPARAITEMVRVTRARGRVVVSDLHWDALATDHPDRTRTRMIVHTAFGDIRHGWIGRQLPRLMTDAGLIDIQVEGHALRVISQVLRQVLNSPLTRAQQQGHLDETEIAQR
jgi:hypothetical protein